MSELAYTRQPPQTKTEGDLLRKPAQVSRDRLGHCDNTCNGRYKAEREYKSTSNVLKKNAPFKLQAKVQAEETLPFGFASDREQVDGQEHRFAHLERIRTGSDRTYYVKSDLLCTT